MQLVPCNDEPEPPDRNRTPVAYAATPPRFGVQPLEQKQIASSHRLEFVEQPAPCPIVEARGGDVRILIESGQRRLICPRDAQRTVRKDALGIDHVTDHLAQAPLSVGVTLE